HLAGRTSSRQTCGISAMIASLRQETILADIGEVVFFAEPPREILRRLAFFLSAGHKRRVYPGVSGLDAEKFQHGGVHGLPVLHEGHRRPLLPRRKVRID